MQIVTAHLYSRNDEHRKAMSPQLQSMIFDSQWAKNLAPDHLERLCHDVVERSYEPGETISRDREPADYWMGVVAGMVKVETTSECGSTAFACVPAGSWFGEGSVLKREPRPYSVVAICPSRMACISRRTFEWLLDSSFSFNRFILAQLNARCGQYIALLEGLRLRHPSSRVALSLAALFNPELYPATDRRLCISQEEIAQMAGLSRQSTNRVLSELEAAGLLRIEYRAVRILDLKGLCQVAKAGGLQHTPVSSEAERPTVPVFVSSLRRHDAVPSTRTIVGVNGT